MSAVPQGRKNGLPSSRMPAERWQAFCRPCGTSQTGVEDSQCSRTGLFSVFLAGLTEAAVNLHFNTLHKRLWDVAVALNCRVVVTALRCREGGVQRTPTRPSRVGPLHPNRSEIRRGTQKTSASPCIPVPAGSAMCDRTVGATSRMSMSTGATCGTIDGAIQLKNPNCAWFASSGPVSFSKV